MFKSAEWIKGFVDGMSAIWPDRDDFTTPQVASGYDEDMAGNDDYGEGFNAANDQRQLLDDWTAPLLVKAPATTTVRDIDAAFARIEGAIASIQRYPVNPDAPEEGTDIPITEVEAVEGRVFAPSPPDGGPCVMCRHDASVHWVAATGAGCDACPCTAYVAYTP